MKFLILSSNNGGGHNSVAAALKQQCTEQGDTVDICDCMTFISGTLSDAVSFSHVFMYRHVPRLFDGSYDDTGKKHEIFRDKTALRRFINLGAEKLGKQIQKERYDAVICVHVFAGLMLSEAVRRYHLSVRTGIVETDYCNTPGCANNDLDYHFIPDAGLIPELTAAGVPEDRIVVSGIPVRKTLLRRFEKTNAKHMLGIPQDHDHILLMGGSMGCGPIPELLELLAAELPETTDVSVVCGTNIKMEKELKEKFGPSSNVHIFGYMPDMFWIYAATDVFVTKPGGISVTEAGVFGLPMVLVNVVGGCERYNLKFFTERGAALSGKDEFELASCIEELIMDREKRDRMSAAIRRLVNPDAAKEICATFQD